MTNQVNALLRKNRITNLRPFFNRLKGRAIDGQRSKTWAEVFKLRANEDFSEKQKQILFDLADLIEEYRDPLKLDVFFYRITKETC